MMVSVKGVSELQMKSLPDIKPCPFCGSRGVLEEIPNKASGHVTWSVGCTEQDGESECMGYQSLSEFSHKIEAIEAWNKRHADGVVAEIVTPDNVNLGHTLLKRKLLEALAKVRAPITIENQELLK